MKIALLHYSAPPVVGGVESVMAEHARLLAADGHEVTIIAGRGSSFDHRVAFHRVPIIDSRHPAVQRMKSFLDAGNLPPDFLEFQREIERELKAALLQTDVLIAHNVCSLPMNLALTAALYEDFCSTVSPRLILWHHDLAWSTPRYSSVLYDRNPWNLLRLYCPRAEQVVVSELRRQELVGLYNIPERIIRVIPNGINPARFYKWEAQTAAIVERLNLLEASPLLLMPVRLTPRKNVELALCILKEVAAVLPDAALLITGPLGPHNRANLEYFSGLLELRRELGLEGRAHFLAEGSSAFLPDEIIYDLYRMADALLLPSREEGFGIPILEAALERIPIFCADIPPLRDLGGEHALYFSPDGDAAEIAMRIVDQVSGSAEHALRARVRTDYTWQRIYQEHLTPLIYNKGAGNGSE